jgi:putative transcriptional regulator
MSKRNLYEELREGIEEMRRFDKGQADLVTHAPDIPDVKKIRKNLGVTQIEFAAMLRSSVKTVQNWEQRRVSPSGPALALLMIAEKQPDALAVLKADL